MTENKNNDSVCANEQFEGFSPAVLTEIDTLSNGSFRYVTTSTFGDIDTNMYKILGFRVVTKERPAILNALKNKYKNSEYQFFYTQMTPKHEYICVLKTADQYDILKAFSTNGINYDVDTEALIAKLTEWDELYGITIVGADGDWVDIRFTKKPSNMLEFAQEVYEFCPDSVEQGADSVEELASIMEEYGGVYLWWD